MSQDSQNSKKASAGENKLSQALNLFADTLSGAIEAAAYLHENLNSGGNSFTRSDALGQIAEITLDISASGTGELCVLLGNTLNHYPASAKAAGQEFKRGQRVKIVEVGVSTMFVEAV